MTFNFTPLKKYEKISEMCCYFLKIRRRLADPMQGKQLKKKIQPQTGNYRLSSATAVPGIILEQVVR